MGYNVKKLGILIFMLIVFSSFVFAVEPSLFTDRFYYSHDNLNTTGTIDIDISGNGNNGSIQGAQTGESGKINESYGFDGLADYVDVGTNKFLTDARGSVSAWVKHNSSGDADTILSLSRTADSWLFFTFRIDVDDKLRFYMRDGANVVQLDVKGNTVLNTNEWYYVTLTQDGSGARIYVNGSEETLTNSTSTDLGAWFDDYVSGTTHTHIGNVEYGGTPIHYFKGNIDEIALYNRSLSQSEIVDLYNGGVGLNPYTAVLDNFSITTISGWDNLSVNNITLIINGTDHNQSYSNTTGNFVLTGLSNANTNLYNMTITSPNAFDKVLLNQNVTNDLIVDFNETDINFSFFFSTGDYVTTPINLTSLNTGEFFNVTGGSINIFPSASIQNFSVRCDNEVFEPFNFSLNFSAKENATYNFTVNETQNVLTFLDANTTLPIDNASITVYYPSGASDTFTTNSSGQINFSYIYNNTLEFGNYNFEFSKLGYTLINLSDTINTSNIPFSATYNISRASIFINIFNRDGHALLSGVNVSVAFVGLFNETTLTGNLTKNNLSIVSGDYIIYAGADGYKTEARTFTFTNQEELTINFYLLNLSNANIGKLFATTTDSFFRKITDAPVELLEYSPSDLSFISVSECVTNINAECSFSIELNVKTYYLRATSIIDGEFLVAETNQDGEIITTTNEIRNLIFYTRPEFAVSPVNNLIYTISESFVNNVSQISVEFNSFDGSAIEVCIEYFKRVGTNFTSVTGDTYCLVSSSAIQNIDASVTLNRSNDYEARVYIKQSSNNINLKTFIYPSSLSTGEIFDDEFKGAIIMIFWVFALAFVVMSKNITFWFWVAIILSWAEVLIFPTFTIVSISVAKTMISGFTLMVARKKKDFN